MYPFDSQRHGKGLVIGLAAGISGGLVSLGGDTLVIPLLIGLAGDYRLCQGWHGKRLLAT